MASNSGWTPLFLRADPIRTGVKLRLMVARRMAAYQGHMTVTCQVLSHTPTHHHSHHQFLIVRDAISEKQLSNSLIGISQGLCVSTCCV